MSSKLAPFSDKADISLSPQRFLLINSELRRKRGTLCMESFKPQPGMWRVCFLFCSVFWAVLFSLDLCSLTCNQHWCGSKFIRKTAIDYPSGSHVWLLILTASLQERNEGSFPDEEPYLWEVEIFRPKSPSRKWCARLGPLGSLTPEPHSSNCMCYAASLQSSCHFWARLIFI